MLVAAYNVVSRSYCSCNEHRTACHAASMMVAYHGISVLIHTVAMGSSCVERGLTDMLTPSHVDEISDGLARVPLEDHETHAKHCEAEICEQCFLQAAFDGCVRRGHRRRTFAPDNALAWKTRFVFNRYGCEAAEPWICQRPVAWGGVWAYGCWPCNYVYRGKGTAMARIAAKTPRSVRMKEHEASKEHTMALRILSTAPVSSGGGEVGAISTALSGVPRLDRWLTAATLVETYGSLRDGHRVATTSGVGAQLQEGDCINDDSSKVMRQCWTALRQPLSWRDMEVFANATSTGIAFDERAGLLFVHARVYVRASKEVYECLIGAARDYGTTPSECLAGIKQVFRNACTELKGRQVHKDKSVAGAGNVFRADIYERLCNSVVNASPDGGLTEQKACYEASPAAQDPANRDNPLFKHLDDIGRDRAHKWRSIMKLVWANIDAPIREFLDELVTGDGSFARMLQTSSKYNLLFQDLQRKAKMNVTDAFTFCNLIKNLSHKEARYDSRTEPLFRLFKLLPIAFETLLVLASSTDVDDKKRSKILLRTFAGPTGYDKLVSAAVVGDGMMVIGKYVNKAQDARTRVFRSLLDRWLSTW